jgi:hypothetical protein
MNIEQHDSMILLAKQCNYLKKIYDELGKRGTCKLNTIKDFTQIEQIMQTLNGLRYMTAADLLENVCKESKVE